MGCSCQKRKDENEIVASNEIKEQHINDNTHLYSNVKIQNEQNNPINNNLKQIESPDNASSKISVFSGEILSLDRNFSMVADFAQNLLMEFNEIRTNPGQYIYKIKNHIKYIKTFSGKEIYDERNGPKIALNKGKVAFQDCISYLETLQPINALKLSKQITIEINESEDKEKLLEKKFMNDAINSIKIANELKHLNFHYDYGSSNPEISCVIQVVDDNVSNFYRRNNILNPNYNYVGITITGIKKKKFLVYCTFC